MNNRFCTKPRIFNNNFYDNYEYYSIQTNKKVKILNLILYSKSQHYDNMKNILLPYLQYIKSILDFDFYFYCFDPSLKKNYIIKDNILYIKGKESYTPGILDKTIKAFEIFKNIDYEYVVRTNISSIVDFKLLNIYLTNNKVHYGGGYIWNANGFKYVSGTCIILNKNLVQKIIDNKEKILGYKRIDDVALAIYLFKELNVPMSEFGISWNTDTLQNRLILYRNHRGSEKRNEDLKAMSKLVEQLMKMK